MRENIKSRGTCIMFSLITLLLLMVSSVPLAPHAAASTSSVTVLSVNGTGAAITGYQSVLYASSGIFLSSGFTPKTFPTTFGLQYTVRAENYGRCTFSTWSDGVATNPRPFTATGSALTFTAVYNCSDRAAGLIIPLYFYPDSSWSTIIQLRNTYPAVPITVVLNPGDGPGVHKDPNYATWIANLQAAGVTVLGYVYTSFASRSVTSAESDISTWKLMYSVNGVFLDQMSNKLGQESYYSTLTSYAHSDGLATVMGNPGCSVPSTYLGTVDVILTYENAGIPSVSTLYNYTAAGTRSDYATVSYGVSSLSTANVYLLANYVSDIYLTSGSMPAPYSSLPPYLSTLVADANSFVAGTSPLSLWSVDTTGAPISGAWTTVSSGGNVVYEGMSPLTFMGTTGSTYTVTVANHDSQTFKKWQDGTTSPTETITLSAPRALTATFTTTLSITVTSVTSSGPLTGMRTTFYYQGINVAQGFTPMTFVGTPGAAYTVCVNNYLNLIFSHWNDGNTSSCKTVTLTQNQQLTATYSG